MITDETYKITDLYIAAYLKALGHRCEMQVVNKRCFFIFPFVTKQIVADLMQSSDSAFHNVNAANLINQVKQLKAYVNNV